MKPGGGMHAAAVPAVMHAAAVPALVRAATLSAMLCAAALPALAAPNFEAVRKAHAPSDVALLSRHGTPLQQVRVNA